VSYSQRSKIEFKEADGIYLVDSGKCTIINYSDSFKPQTLKNGDFFGEDDILKVIVNLHLNDKGFRLLWGHSC